jgi:hypothetical protein
MSLFCSDFSYERSLRRSDDYWYQKKSTSRSMSMTEIRLLKIIGHWKAINKGMKLLLVMGVITALLSFFFKYPLSLYRFSLPTAFLRGLGDRLKRGIYSLAGRQLSVDWDARKRFPSSLTRSQRLSQQNTF